MYCECIRDGYAFIALNLLQFLLIISKLRYQLYLNCNVFKRLSRNSIISVSCAISVSKRFFKLMKGLMKDHVSSKTRKACIILPDETFQLVLTSLSILF